MPDLSVSPGDAVSAERARAIAGALSAPLVSTPPPSGFTLLIGVDGIRLRDNESRQRPLLLDFASPDLVRRGRRGRDELLGQAAGLRRGRHPLVLDGTAGLGRESYLLAAMGARRVELCERSTVLAILLEDALARARVDSTVATTAARMVLHNMDMCEWLAANTTPDVIYLDPMFPPRKRSALAKGEMQMLQRLLGACDEPEKLLAAALESGAHRVVFKRARGIAPMLDATLSFPARHFTFDVYLN